MDSLIVNSKHVANIINKTNLPVADLAANPYLGCTHACKYCYASFMKRFSNHQEPWGEFLDVKFWKETADFKKYAGKELFLGSVCDPYLPQEKEFERTRALLLQLQDVPIKLRIATKSDLILRDLELLKKFSDVQIAWSINTLDPLFQRSMDRAVSIERRFKSMEIFFQEGFVTTCFISPIFPKITQVQEIILKAQDFCHFVYLENLNLRGDFKWRILDFIAHNYPSLMPLYEAIYINGDLSFWQDLDFKLQEFAKSLGLTYVINERKPQVPQGRRPLLINYFYHEKIKKNAKI